MIMVNHDILLWLHKKFYNQRCLKLIPYFLTVSAYSAAATSVNWPLGASFSSHEKNSHKATASLTWITHKPQLLYEVFKPDSLLNAIYGFCQKSTGSITTGCTSTDKKLNIPSTHKLFKYKHTLGFLGLFLSSEWLSTAGRHSFSVAGACKWNNLLSDIISSSLLLTIKQCND